MRQARTYPSKHMAISSGVDRLAVSTQWNSAPLVSITLTNIMLKEKPGTKKRYDYTDVKDKRRQNQSLLLKVRTAVGMPLGGHGYLGENGSRLAFGRRAGYMGVFDR